MTEQEQEREHFDAERYFEGTEVADRFSTKRIYLVRASKWMHDHAEGYRTDPHCAESLVEEFLQIEKETTLRWLVPMECEHATCYQQLKPSEDRKSIEKICLICQVAAPKPAPPAPINAAMVKALLIDAEIIYKAGSPEYCDWLAEQLNRNVNFAVRRAAAEQEVASAAMEYDTECPACDGKYQCTLDRNHAGPHKAHGFDRVLHEWTLSTPSPTEGASSPADARTELVQKEVGEGLREALDEMRKEAKQLIDRSEVLANNGEAHRSDLSLARGREIEGVVARLAALAAPAPKPAPPAKRDNTDLEGRLNTGADFPS